MEFETHEKAETPAAVEQVVEKSRSARIFDYLTKNKVAAMLVVVILLIAFNTFQQWQDRRAFEKNEEAIRKFEAERQQSQQQTQGLLGILNQQTESTSGILEAVKSVNLTISGLIENDRRQQSAVANLQKEYLDAKIQNSNDPKIINRRAVRRALPVSERERRALAIDRQLYPDGANGN